MAALVLPLLLGLHRLQNTQDVRSQRFFSAQAAVQVALLFVILASAMLRMRLYQEACGLTELRLYTMAFMGWLAVVFAWFVSDGPAADAANISRLGLSPPRSCWLSACTS